MSPRHLVTDDPTSPIVEQGANWIHGYKSNYVLWPLATKLGMHGAHTNYSDNPGPQDPSAPRAIYMVSTVQYRSIVSNLMHRFMLEYMHSYHAELPCASPYPTHPANVPPTLVPTF